jgi:hypothetical protein
MTQLETLKGIAREKVSKVSNNPDERLQMRHNFYQKYGNPIIKGKEGLGNSEIAFMEWEIHRGVLNPLDAHIPGSKWWRTVNSHFMYLSELAALIHESKENFEDLSPPVHFWLAYIKSCDGITWYRAHNSSIIDGYKVAFSLALEEQLYERQFMNIVLYRLLYAQSMVEEVNFGFLGKILANPRGNAVALITEFEDFYPKHYPLGKEGVEAVLHKSHTLSGLAEDFMDEVLILPQLDKLCKEAATWNQSPVLTSYVQHNKPCYALDVTQ